MAGSVGQSGGSTASPWPRRVFDFLHAHPTRRPAANWSLWALCLIVVIAIAAGSSGHSKQNNVTASLGSTATTLAPSTVATSTVPPSTTSTVQTAPITTPAESSGTYVTNSAGVVLPNPQRTPGAVNPQVTQADIGSTICESGWTSTVRPPSEYTTSLKVQQLATGYAYNGDSNPSDYEEDHLISLELGGSPTSVLNLWPEPYNVTDGARTKDQIENKLKALVCSGSLSLTKAQQMIATNWFVAYETYIGSPSGNVAPPSTSAPVTSPPPQPASLTCTASMSNSAPSDNTTDDVSVQTSAGASVTATAHYKSTNTTHSGTANGSGQASIPFDIGRATIGYTVKVDVTVSSGSATASCSTSFTPQ